MAIGDTVQAGLMRIDSSPILLAGQAQARVGENLGRTVGGLIEQYSLNKEKQKKNEGFIKSQSSMLDMLAEQDPEMAPRYAAMKAELNNPDIALSTRAELGKNLAKNISLSSQLKGQRLLQETQAQTLKERQDTENLRNELLEQKKSFNDLGIELRRLEAEKGKALSAAEVQNTLAKYKLSGKQIQEEEKLLPKRTEAMEAQLDTSIMESQSRQQILPGETSTQIKKQEIVSKQLDVENELMDIIGIQDYAQMKADDLKSLSELQKAKVEQTKSYASYLRNKGLSDLITAAKKADPSFKERFSPLVEMSGKVLTTDVKVPGSNKRVPFKEYLEMHEDDATKYPLNGLPAVLNAQLLSLENATQEVLRDQQVQVNVPDEPQVSATTSTPTMGQSYDYGNLDPSVADLMTGPGAVTPQITDPAAINLLRQGGTFKGKNLEQLIAEGAIRGQ